MIKNVLYTGLHVKYLFFLSNFNKTGIFKTNFENDSNIKFHTNALSCRPCGQTDRQDEAYSRFCNFVKAPKKCNLPLQTF
jgi:hypothetical protein